jgi:hypothetical protein
MSTPTASNSSIAANGGISATTGGVPTTGGNVPAAPVVPPATPVAPLAAPVAPPAAPAAPAAPIAPAAPVARPQPNQPRGGASGVRGGRNRQLHANKRHPQSPQVTLPRPRNYDGLNLHLRNQILAHSCPGYICRWYAETDKTPHIAVKGGEFCRQHQDEVNRLVEESGMATRGGRGGYQGRGGLPTGREGPPAGRGNFQAS